MQVAKDNSDLMERPQKTKGGISYLARPGDGPTVVFLHGIGSNAGSFRPVFERLPPQANLIAWNAPGYLSSDPVDDPWPVPKTYAEALCRFLDELKLPKIHLVGHSLGTLIAGTFARSYPDRLGGLVLVSAANGYRVAKGGQLPAKVRARIDDLDQLGVVAFANARAANLVHEPVKNSDVVAQVESAMAEIEPGGYAQAVHLLASGDLPGDLAQVPIMPSFIIGAQDRVTPMEQTQAAAQAWADAHGRQPPIHVIEGTGHAVYLQKPSEFASILNRLVTADEAAEFRAILPEET